MNTCYFEDAHVGYTTEAYEHKVTAKEIIDFALSWDPMPFHIDEALAKESVYKGLTASGAHVYAIMIKLAHKQQRKMAVIAALGVKNMSFSAPVRPDDILYLTGVCLTSRESKSKSDRGICEFEFKVINQHREVVLQLTQPLMLAKKNSGLDVFSRA
ncbi:MAG: acyl dehydratase [Pseudomonadales bacterium]|nr:acyl dehydratase [Pseudomonadales bacterium]